MGGDSSVKRPLPADRRNVASQLFSGISLSRRSFGFFLILVAIIAGGYYFWRTSLRAEAPIDASNTINLELSANGNLYLANSRLSADVFQGAGTYRYRYQIIDHPNDFIDKLTIDLTLPKPGTEETIGHSFINNGGAETVDSQLINPTTVEYTATAISTQSQLAIEVEVPQSFIQRSILFNLREQIAALPVALWAGISIGLPALTGLLLLVVAVGRTRRVPSSPAEFTDPPSRLSPAVMGILLRGRLTSRELAATFVDLARRGHLVIRQVSNDDFRFRRLSGNDRLADYELSLLNQIFGPVGEQTTSEEISFSLAQEVFSKRVSESFILAYRKISDLGYFYTNPLSLHRRYQVTGILLFILGMIGFFANLFLFTGIQYGLLFWAGMMAAALLVVLFSRGLPVRTIYGDREVGKWLAFRRFLASKEPINYAAHSQEKYLAYLPYAIVLEVEQEWTRRFYDLPFAQPSWYVAANITTIDEFANKIFPLFGYLSHALALTAQPATQ